MEESNMSESNKESIIDRIQWTTENKSTQFPSINNQQIAGDSTYDQPISPRLTIPTSGHNHSMTPKASEKPIFTNHDTYATLIGASMGGLLGRTILHPIDTIKAVHQVTNTQYPTGKKNTFKYNSKIYSTFLNIKKNDGIKGLYKGYSIAALGSIPACCLYFTFYEYSKYSFEQSNILSTFLFLRDFTCGFIAETISCAFWVPIDVCKERLQAQSELKVSNYRGSFHAFKSILQTEGFTQLYKGYGATLSSFGPFSAFYFLFYEQFKKVAHNFNHNFSNKVDSHNELSAFQFMLSSAAAGSCAAFITNPLDMVKLRLQVQRQTSGLSGKSTYFRYDNFAQGLYSLIRDEGLRATFRGVSARILYHTPNVAITITTMEKFKQWYIST